MTGGDLSVCGVKEEELGLFGYIKGSDEWMLKFTGKTLQVGETNNGYKKRVEKARKETF